MAPAPLVAIVDAVDRELPDLRAAADLARLVQVTGVEGLEVHLPELDAVFAWNFDRPRLLEVVPRAPRLRWIQSISAGVEELASPTLPAHGVVLTNAAGVYDPSLAESVLGFVLAFSTRLLEDARLRPGEWPADEITLLRGTTALVVGAGSIGTEVGRLLRAAGLHVRGVARTPRTPDETFDAIVGVEELHAELARADHVVNVLPITAATRGLFDAAAFDVDAAARGLREHRPGIDGGRASLDRGARARRDRRRGARCVRGGAAAHGESPLADAERAGIAAPRWRSRALGG